MKSPAPTIPKDLVNELKILAVAASADDATFTAAQENVAAAGGRLTGSATKFAGALYDFALRYANQPGLVEAKLQDSGISFRSPSVFQCISRLAFDDVPQGNSDAIRQKIWRYGRLIELAHQQRKSADEFRQLVEKSIASALQKLRAAPIDPQPAIDLGRLEVSKLFANQSVPLAAFSLPSSVELKDGEDVELLATFEGGQLVVYGLVPPSVGKPSAVLAKIGTPLLPKKKPPLALLPDLQRALKLVTSDKDDAALATYEVRGDRLYFTVVGDAAVSVLSAASDYDLLEGKTLTMPVATWARVCTSLIPLSRITQDVAFDGITLVVSVDPEVAFDLGRWCEEKGKSITIGKAADAALYIPLKDEATATHAVESAAWQDSVTLGEDDLAPLLDFKPKKTLTALKFGAGAIAVKASAKKVTGEVNLKRKQLSLLKKACAKLLSYADDITLDHTETHLRASATNEDGILFSVLIEVA